MKVFKFLEDKKSGLKSLGLVLFALVALAATHGANASTIGDAVDTTAFTWTTGGDANWFYQTSTTKDGIDAAQSGDIDDNQSTWMQTEVTGPGTLLFWWKVSSEDTGDYLRFYVDGSEFSSVVGISGYLAWSQKLVSISNGVHTLRWEYAKDGSTSDPPDCGWVDQVIWSSIPYYMVSANANVASWGSVTGSGAYKSNTTCTVAATAYPGFMFVNWLEGTNIVATTANYEFTVLSNRTLKAKFTPTSYMIGTTANPLEGGTTSGGNSFPYNSTCTVVATPNPGYAFVNWTENGTNVWNASSNYTFTVSSARTLVANFTLVDFFIETSSNPFTGGTTSGGGEKGYQSTCALIATPYVGYTFTNWTEGGIEVSASSDYTFTVERDRTLVANFTPVRYMISTSANPSVGGTISGGGLIDYNSSCTIVATTNIGYTFTSWTVDDSFVSASISYTFTVMSNETYVANFADLGRIGEAVDAPSLAWTTGGGSPWFFQTNITHDAVDAAQSTNQAVLGAKSWVQTNVTGPGMLSFWCKVEPTGTDNDALSFYDNAVSKWAVETDNGWTNFVYYVSGGTHALKWEFHNQGSASPGNAWLDEVVWTPFEFTVSTSSSPLEGGIANGGGVFPSNTTCTVTAAANPDYEFANWTVDGIILATTSNYTFTVVSDQMLVANFVYVSTLGDAVDAPELVWTTGGDAGNFTTGATTNWYPQRMTTHDGVDAVQSGRINEAGVSWMQTTMVGPGTLSFWWKVSSAQGFDFLRFTIDAGSPVGEISGEVDWQQKVYSLPAGTHILKWAYMKGNSNRAGGLDSGWVDQVVWTEAPVSLSPVYRFWSPVFSGHFFTMNETEKNNIIAELSSYWTYEGIAYYAFTEQVAETLPVYRFWSPVFAGHFYTMNEVEKNNIISGLSAYWIYEGVSWYACPTQVVGTVPVYRFWSPVFAHHFFTINETEKNNIISGLSAYWTYEGIAYYAFETMSRNRVAGLSRSETTEDLPEKSVTTVASSRLTKRPTMVYPGNTASDSGAASLQLGETTDFGDIVFPLSYPGCNVAAYVYDSIADQWTCVLEATNSPATATFSGILPSRRYLLEVFSGDPADDKLASVHRSWVQTQLDPPVQLNEISTSTVNEGGVGSPIICMRAPEAGGAITVKLYSASRGVVQTLTELFEGEELALSLPELNCWYWIGCWRNFDNELVLSLWLRHGTEE